MIGFATIHIGQQLIFGSDMSTFEKRWPVCLYQIVINSWVDMSGHSRAVDLRTESRPFCHLDSPLTCGNVAEREAQACDLRERYVPRTGIAVFAGPACDTLNAARQGNRSRAHPDTQGPQAPSELPTESAKPAARSRTPEHAAGTGITPVPDRAARPERPSRWEIDMITRRDVADQVAGSLPHSESTEGAGIDAEAIVNEIIERHGLVDIETIDHDEYWEIVRKHDATQQS